MHALQEAGQVLRGRVVGGGDLRHHGRRLGPGGLHAALVGQDVGEAQDPVHLRTTTGGGNILIFKKSFFIFFLPLRIRDGKNISS